MRTMDRSAPIAIFVAWALLATTPATAQDAELLIALDLGYWSAPSVYDGAVESDGGGYELATGGSGGSSFGGSAELRPYRSPWILGARYTRSGGSLIGTLCQAGSCLVTPDFRFRIRDVSAYGGRTLIWVGRSFTAEAGVLAGMDQLLVGIGASPRTEWAPRGGAFGGLRLRGDAGALALRGEASLAATDGEAAAGMLPPGFSPSESQWMPVYRLTIVLQLDVLPYLSDMSLRRN